MARTKSATERPCEDEAPRPRSTSVIHDRPLRAGHASLHRANPTEGRGCRSLAGRRRRDPRTILGPVGTIRAHLVPLDVPPEGVEPALHEASPGTPVPLPALDLPRSRRPGWPTLAGARSRLRRRGDPARRVGSSSLMSAPATSASSPDAPALERAVAILAGPSTERFPLRGSMGRIALVVGAGERGVLALDGLGRAPDDRIYAAWLVPPGSATPVRVATVLRGRARGAALAPGGSGRARRGHAGGCACTGPAVAKPPAVVAARS